MAANNQVQAFCENCGTNTIHNMESVQPINVNPTSHEGGKIDLTGKNETPSQTLGMSAPFMSEMRSLQCTRCGSRVMNAGVTPQARDNDFAALMAGRDWKAPPEPKE